MRRNEQFSENAIINKFVGNATPEQLINVESFIGNKMAVFIPCIGHCFYSISNNHTHPSFTFYYSYDKKIKMAVGGKIHKALPGFISGLAPDIEHHEIPSEHYIRFIALCVDKNFFLEHCAIYNRPVTSEMLSYIKLPEQFLPSVKNFMIETSCRNESSNEVIRAIEIQIIHLLLRSLFSVKIDSAIITERADIDRIVEHINDHFAEEINLENLAEMAAFSKSHLSRLFKRETGLTIQDYIIKVRIGRSKIFLRRADMKLTEIAYKCGFSSSSHFTASFVKHVGIQPSLYKKDVCGRQQDISKKR